MDKILLNLENSKKYVVACSFGPDSMALLFSAIKQNLNVVVAHVNYRKRDISQFEQDELTKYCKENDIKIYILDLKGKKSEGNFQDWARKTRYEFFKEIVDKEGAEAVLVAHNEDDLIETYIMQKNRGNFVKNYGISRENTIFGVKVIRPLLDYPKQFLQDFDDENGIPYSIDQSNLEDKYTRNKVRHNIVQKLSTEERKRIRDEINEIRQKRTKYRTQFTKQEFLDCSYSDFVLMLDSAMQITKEHRDLSEKFFNEIIKAFKTKTNLRVKITDSFSLELDYEEVFLVNACKIKRYQIEFKNVFKNEWIDIDFSHGASDRGIAVLPDKLVLKNCEKNDKYIIRDYNSQVNRLFIDWKMPLFLREVWPGIYDENGKLIYIPRYRKNFVDNHTAKFKINTEYFLEF